MYSYLDNNFLECKFEVIFFLSFFFWLNIPIKYCIPSFPHTRIYIYSKSMNQQNTKKTVQCLAGIYIGKKNITKRTKTIIWFRFLFFFHITIFETPQGAICNAPWEFLYMSNMFFFLVIVATSSLNAFSARNIKFILREENYCGDSFYT